MTAIIDCLGGNWTPRFGDVGWQPWITVLVYLICGFLSVQVWRGQGRRILRQFWAFVSILMLFLAVNKQLDLQTALTETGRCLSIAQGWHGYRRYAQMLFLIVLSIVLILVMLRASRMLRDYLPSHWMALAGTAMVCFYVMIRATSFYLIDMIGGTHILGLSMNFVLENAGLVLIAMNAIGLLRGRITVDGFVPPVLPQRRVDSRPKTAPPRPPVAVEGEGTAEVRPFRPLAPRRR